MYSVYICRNCGAEYDEQPDDRLCSSCFENEVYSSDYVMGYWDDEEEY